MWVLKVVFLVTIFFASWAMADEIKNPETDETQEETRDPIAKAIEDQQGQVKVVFDITRGVQKARIIKDGQVVSEHKISGAKNKPIVVTVDGRRNKFCAFTTTGTNIKPTHAYKSYYSKEHKVDLANFVTFDYDRGIGGHQGDTSGFSSGCVRQTAKGAKAVYDAVMAHSEVTKGSPKLKSTNVTIDVIDNTPGRYTAECDCLKNHMGDTRSARALRVCGIAAKETKTAPTAPDTSVRPKKRPEAKVAAQPEVTRPKAQPAKPAKKSRKTLKDILSSPGLY